MQHRLVKTGGRLVKHARYYWLMLAESHLTRRLFGSMLGRIDALTLATGTRRAMTDAKSGRPGRGAGEVLPQQFTGLRVQTDGRAGDPIAPDHWEERWADTRIHGATKQQVSAMFAVEKPALLPLPVEPFRYYQYSERTDR